MQSLLNVPAEVVSANISKEKAYFCPGDHGGCLYCNGSPVKQSGSP